MSAFLGEAPPIANNSVSNPILVADAAVVGIDVFSDPEASRGLPKLAETLGDVLKFKEVLLIPSAPVLNGSLRRLLEYRSDVARSQGRNDVQHIPCWPPYSRQPARDRRKRMDAAKLNATVRKEAPNVLSADR